MEREPTASGWPSDSSTLGAPHTWEGTTLVVAEEDEAWVERIMDQVDEELATAPDEAEDEEQVAYDLSEWDDDACVDVARRAERRSDPLRPRR